MRKLGMLSCLMFACCVIGQGVSVEAATPTNQIEKGIYIGNMDVSGMTLENATTMIQEYVSGVSEKEIELLVTQDKTVTVTAAELGLKWENQDVVEEASRLGKDGNILQRYKALKDLEHEKAYYSLEFAFSEESVKQVLEEKCKVYDIEPKEATITRVEGGFKVTEEQTGVTLDVETSKNTIMGTLNNGWNDELMTSIPLTTEIAQPHATSAELSKIKDVLGAFNTSFKSSGKSRVANVTNGSRLVNGSVLMPGEEYSFYDHIKPFTEENGYFMAGSYLNGQVVDSLGGGICQVSTTLYNAVLRAELDVTMRHNHSMIVTYVDPSADAAIAESSGKDFRFVNNTGAPVYIESYVDNKVIYMIIYGVETRPSNRKVVYESVVVSQKEPDQEIIYQNAGLPVGNCTVTKAHIGCKAQLWKVVYENNVEVSREQINSSSYQSSPKSCVVGTAASNPEDYNEIMAAISTGSVDHVKNVSNIIAARNTPAPPPVAQPAQ